MCFETIDFLDIRRSLVQYFESNKTKQKERNTWSPISLDFLERDLLHKKGRDYHLRKRGPYLEICKSDILQGQQNCITTVLH